jgi:hypothetical protein
MEMWIPIGVNEGSDRLDDLLSGSSCSLVGKMLETDLVPNLMDYSYRI